MKLYIFSIKHQFFLNLPNPSFKIISIFFNSSRNLVLSNGLHALLVSDLTLEDVTSPFSRNYGESNRIIYIFILWKIITGVTGQGLNRRKGQKDNIKKKVDNRGLTPLSYRKGRSGY